MRKNYNIVSIDFWGTIAKGGNSDEIYAEVCKKHTLNYDQFMRSRENNKGMLTVLAVSGISKVAYWSRILLGVSGANNINICKFIRDVDDAYREHYKLNLVHSNIIKFIRANVNAGREVVILSNTGYMGTEELYRLITTHPDMNKSVLSNFRVVGSDMVGSSKPSENFYKIAMGLTDDIKPSKWIHIGNLQELDIDPVRKLKGEAYLVRNASEWIKLFEAW